VPSPEAEAQLEGAANLWRYHVRGWVPFWLCVAGIALVGLAFAGVNHLLAVHGPHPAVLCHTVAQCNRYILSHPVHVTGSMLIPVFHPLTLTPP
jgi:hypothetical protein